MFVSYSQNFEDVMLNRLFGDRDKGFYIDVGAQHPYYDSVTKAFYDRGWRGINIEPVKQYFDLLQQQRAQDTNLNFALGQIESELTFYELEGTGLSSFDRQTAQAIAEKDNYPILTYQVPVKTLADICREYVTQQIDFLKIDVEGWEEQVLLGNDWQDFRPIVIIVEATIPNSPVKVKTNIPQLLADRDYDWVYFDGLNDYYLAKEHSELKQHFATPPNVFDKFISARTIEAREQTQEKEQELHILNNKYQDQFYEIQRLTKYLSEQQQSQQGKSNLTSAEITQLQTQLAQSQTQLKDARQLVIAMETSKFWKMRSAWFKLKRILAK